MKRFVLIDYLRGISIFTIVVIHLRQGYAGGALQKALSFGGADGSGGMERGHTEAL